MLFSRLFELLCEEAPRFENLLPIQDYIEYAGNRNELIISDQNYDYIVVSPKSLETSSYYVGGKTKVPFCTADGEDPSSFNIIRTMGLKFYYFLSKTLSIKNRNAKAIYAIIGGHLPVNRLNLTGSDFANMYTDGTKRQMVASKLRKNPNLSQEEAKEIVDREYMYTNPDGSFRDSFLAWADDTLEYARRNGGSFVQIYDSQNKLVSVSNFKRSLEQPIRTGGSPRNVGLFEEFMAIL